MFLRKFDESFLCIFETKIYLSKVHEFFYLKIHKKQIKKIYALTK